MIKRTLLSFLVAIVFAMGILAPQPAVADRKSDLRALVSDMLQAQPKDRMQWWQQNRHRITKEIADLAEEFGNEALSQGNGDDALVLYYFAGMAYMQLDDRQKALNSMLNSLQVRFMGANTPEEYQEIRNNSLSLMKKADSIQASDTAFHAAVLAADSTFFVGEPKPGESADGSWVAAVLADLVPALQRANQSKSAIWLERLVSLTARTLELATEQFFLNREKIETLIKQVVAASDAIIPPDFSFRTQVGDAKKTIVTAKSLAYASYLYGNASVASARLSAAADLARKTGDIEEYLWVIKTRYQGERQAKRAPAQLHQLRQDARSVAQDIRKGYHSRAGRIWSAYEFDEAYGEMLKDELGVEGISSAEALFSAIETLKSRTLLDYMLAPPAEVQSPKLQAQISALEKQIIGFAPADKETEETLLAQEMKLISQLSGFSQFSTNSGERERALVELERLYQINNVGFLDTAAPVPLKAIQQALRPGEAILEYVIPYHALHPASDLGILLITQGNVSQIHLDLEKLIPSKGMMTGRVSADGKAPIDSSPLGNGVISLRTAIQTVDEKRAKQFLGAFHALLIQPLMDRGFHPEEYQRLIVVAHGVLQYVPFAALMDTQGIPLIRKTAISMAPSSTVWLELQKRGGPLGHWVGFANPKLEAQTLPPLENSVQEVKNISTIVQNLNPNVELGELASKDRFLAVAPGANILHLATHGDFPDDNAMDSHGIYLSKGTGGDGMLRAMDIRRLNLKSTRLVVLSICNGGLYRMGPTDEPYGLVPAFLIAGAENVLATLWPLNDDFGRRFTIEFYKHLLQYGPAEALRQASLRFIDENNENLINWAGFLLVGSGRPFTELSKSNTEP